MGVAGKDLVAQGEAVKAHHQRDAHLFAIRPMVTRVAALCQRVGFGLALKISTRHVIQQYFVVDRK